MISIKPEMPPAVPYEPATSLFVPRPYRNFFQYPPITKQVDGQDIDWVDELGLEVDNTGSDFTIFLSIPYCRVRCNSCPYFVTLLPESKDQDTVITEYVEAVIRHLSLFADRRRFMTATCRAVYIGGGTASLLLPKHVKLIVDVIKKRFNCAPGIEITLEGNPHEFNLPYLLEVKGFGINRVSIGYQSSQDEILKDILNSPHTAEEGQSALKNSLAAGFDTVNVDLLYRLPDQTFEQWQRDVRAVIALAPESVTTYEYIIYARTVTEKRIASGDISAPIDQATSQLWYEWMRGEMKAAGYVEPSNHTFAKPGHLQRYSDFTYGKGSELIGLGVKAYSYINGYQFMAPKTLPKYKKSLYEGRYPIEVSSRQPTPRNLMEREIIFKLRRGLKFSKQDFANDFKTLVNDEFAKEIDLLTSNGLLAEDGAHMWLTPLGKEWKANVLEVFYDPSQL